MASSGGKSGQRKVGRLLRKPAHTRYTNERRRERNKIKRIKKHLKRCGDDKVAAKVLKRLA